MSNQYKIQTTNNTKELAPIDNGIEQLDLLCEKYNRGEISLDSLICRVWNTALSIGEQNR